MKVFLKGLHIDVLRDKVTIYDKDGDLTKPEAIVLLKYLKSEGFLLSEQVFLEILDDPEDKSI
jgi:hypothetical protein